MSSPLNLYVSSNGTDHGPLTLEEATKRVASGEFKPDDLSASGSIWLGTFEKPSRMESIK